MESKELKEMLGLITDEKISKMIEIIANDCPSEHDIHGHNCGDDCFKCWKRAIEDNLVEEGE